MANWLLNQTVPLEFAQEFDAAASEKTWTLNQTIDPAFVQTFDAVASEWANHAWMVGGLYIMAAEAGVGTITGTLSITFDGQTVAGDGDLLINGVLAQSFGSMTLTGAGDLDIVGQSSITFAGQTLAGVSDLDIAGTLSVTFGSMTANSDSDLIIQGIQGGQFGDMTLTAIGQLNIASVSDISFDGMTLVASGLLEIENQHIARGGGGSRSLLKRVKVKPRYRKKQYSFLEEEELEKAFEELKQEPEIKKLVKPYKKDDGIDWERFIEDLNKVEILLQEYEKLLKRRKLKSDDDLILMMI